MSRPSAPCLSHSFKGVDARDKRGHDEGNQVRGLLKRATGLGKA